VGTRAPARKSAGRAVRRSPLGQTLGQATIAGR